MRRKVSKPLHAICKVWVSGGTLGTTNSPFLLVATSGSRVPRLSLMRWTVAPSTVAAVESTTLRETVPVVAMPAPTLNCWAAATEVQCGQRAVLFVEEAHPNSALAAISHSLAEEKRNLFRLGAARWFAGWG